jgi:hypothetical protein
MLVKNAARGDMLIKRLVRDAGAPQSSTLSNIFKKAPNLAGIHPENVVTSSKEFKGLRDRAAAGILASTPSPIEGSKRVMRGIDQLARYAPLNDFQRKNILAGA